MSFSYIYFALFLFAVIYYNFLSKMDCSYATDDY